jgi:hypothetical protein
MTNTTHAQTRPGHLVRRSLYGGPATFALVLLALGAAHGCQGEARGSIEGSQTHFLRSCSAACEMEGLECLCGVCTRPCEADLECAELGAGSACLAAAPACAEAAPSCGVECGSDDDCSGVASDMECIAGRCEGPALPATLRQGVSGPPAVGRPCVTEDERFATFSGFSLGEVNVEERGSSCGRELLCIVNRFQGRATCPEGQSQSEIGACSTPAGEPVVVPVLPQLESRPADRHVICSCRCDGPDRNADYCSCPRGMICEELIVDQGGVLGDYAGSYCTYPTPAEPSDDPPTERMDLP